MPLLYQYTYKPKKVFEMGNATLFLGSTVEDLTAYGHQFNEVLPTVQVAGKSGIEFSNTTLEILNPGIELCLGTGDFCVEFELYSYTGNDYYRRIIGSTTIEFEVGDYVDRQQPGSFMVGLGTITANVVTGGVWTHVAHVRKSGTSYLLIDGVQVAEQGDSHDYSKPIRYIGGSYRGNEFYSGVLANIAVTKESKYV